MRIVLALLSILLVVGNVQAFQLKLVHKYRYSSYVSKVALGRGYLAVGFENGTVQIRDFETNKLLYTIKLPFIHDFMGDKMAMPIYSLDIFGDKLLMLTQGENQSRLLYLFDLKSHTLERVYHTKQTIMRARFLSAVRVLFVTLADEVMYFDLKQKRITFKKQIGNYVFSAFSLNGTRNLLGLGDESGVVKVFDLGKKKLVAKVSGVNKDKTLAVSFWKDMVLNASVDEKVAVYNYRTGRVIASVDTKFLPYAAALKGNFAVYQVDEKDDLAVFNINDLSQTQLLKGHTMPLIGMRFYKNYLVSYSPAEIIVWAEK